MMNFSFFLSGKLFICSLILNDIFAVFKSDAEFKTLFIRMLKELSEGFSSIKMIQSEMKDTLI